MREEVKDQVEDEKLEAQAKCQQERVDGKSVQIECVTHRN